MTLAMLGTIFITFWILPWLGLFGDPVKAERWSGVLDESLDERHDAEIFRAVVESMRQWESHKKNPHRTKREASRVCYEEVGCFEDTGPFSYLEMLPSPPKDVGTRFIMYGSRKARSVPMEVPADDINDKANNAIDPDLPTKVIVHGFGSGCEHVWVYEMRSALMSVHDCNIVCVDWSPGSAIPNYVRAAANTRLVGRQLAKLVRSLNVPLEKVHLIGFSLGAHVAGFAGAELANVSRITGLDPAGPLFEAQDPRARLDETDAAFVDVIHSNGEQLILGGLGSWQPMGDVDFYPNGGRMQTGCSNLFLGAVSDIIWSGSIEGRSLCNHRRAYKLFTDSVSPKCRFPAFSCDNGYEGLLKGDCFPCGVNGPDRPCGDMGYYSDTSSARGQLYLVTREEEPFCAHQYQVKVYNSRGERPARSYGKLQVTLVGESNFNETFTMTRKDDEELLVGAMMQKIVVPHPAVLNLEAIEIKYTAYSGWISSGLVSWSVDKVSVLDSFGKALSVCMRGLTLESGRAVYLPLYPGECNIPSEFDNVTTSTASTSMKSGALQMEPIEHETETKPVAGGIGPFTKDHNYERKEDNPPQPNTSDNKRQSEKNHDRTLTEDENVKFPLPDAESVEIAFVPKDGEEESLSSSESKKSVSSPWSYVDVSEGGSNSLENTQVESGRAFSGSSFVAVSTSASSGEIPDTTSTEFIGEVKEPVLQITKKETGRSMRLPEITEPILRPRATRQNVKSGEVSFRDGRQDDMQESWSSSSTPASRAFTVQLLPERLAGILAQAERYARQTLLPLISQYTPSFVGSARQDRVKYFPPLTDNINEEQQQQQPVTLVDGYSVDAFPSSSNTQRNNEVDPNERQSSDSTKTTRLSNDSSRSGKSENLGLDSNKQSSSYQNSQIHKLESFEGTSIEAETNDSGRTKSAETASKENDWIPIETDYHSKKISDNSTSDRNSSRSLNYKWMSELGGVWNHTIQDKRQVVRDAKSDDWVPVTGTKIDKEGDNIEVTTNMGERNLEKSETTIASWEIPLMSSRDVDNSNLSTTHKTIEESNTARLEREKKFIPLVDFENRDPFLAPSNANDVSENMEGTSTTAAAITESSSHIQKIPGPNGIPRQETEALTTRRSMVFPYAYERKKDPRTRYIPLIPEEEMRKSSPLTERDR